MTFYRIQSNVSHIAAMPFIALVQLYRFFISPLLPQSCRFYPSCSAYAMESLKRFGPIHGSLLVIKRIIRCHPFNDGGYDPVPGGHCKNSLHTH